MANTVNDVMNVIASPDYGIKNIAGTTQEILAILGGVHNSKNNIHAIVDDVKNLLQKLVDNAAASKKKPIEIGDKSSKVNPKNIQDILDETKGIRKAIDNLAKIFEKQGGKNMPTVAKLSNKASEKVAKAMIKDIENQKKGGGMAALVDAFTKLKNISLKDIIFGKLKLKQISKVFEKAKDLLKIKEKDLNNIIKLINAAPEIMRALKKVGRRINTIIKNRVIEKLSEMLFGKKNSLLSLAKELQKNKKTFGNASKAAKSIEELSKSLCKVMARIIFTALFSKLATIGIGFIAYMLDNLMQLSQALRKSKKDFDAGSKAAKNIRIFVGNLLVTSIFLTISLITVIPAILGALCLRLLVDTLIPTGKKLSKNYKRMANAAGAALIFTAFTGLMLLSSFFLTKIAETGLMALMGSVVVLGVVSINIITFKILNKVKKEVIIGSIMMAIMSISLLLFGIALGKITKATENVTFKQIAIIVAMTVLLTGAVVAMGIPQVSGFIMLGSISMMIMSVGLIVFGLALKKIANATENLKFKQVLLVSGSILALGLPVAGAGALAIPITLGSVALAALSLALRPFLKTLTKISKATEKLDMKKIGVVASSMGTLGLAVAGMSILTIPIGLGSVALGSMGTTLYMFVKSLKMISDMGGVPEKEVGIVIKVMKSIGNFFKRNALSFRAMKSAKRYKEIMRPFGETVNNLVKLNKIAGKIPTELVYQSLNAMRAIGHYFIDNPIEKKEIKAARRYKRMMRPFTKTVGTLSKLKDMGKIPMNLVYGALNIMNTIADYYKNNPLKKKAIKNARKYKRMLRPFGKTVGFLSQLKKMGKIPMNLVYGALNVMSTIANYYISNPIKKKAIKNARKYKRLMRPFGKTIRFLSELKKMGKIPMNLVYGALNAISAVVGYYRGQNLRGRKGRRARKSARIISQIVSSFSQAVNALKTLKELKFFPTNAVDDTISAIGNITNFYKYASVSGDVEFKSEFIEFAVKKFTDMAKKIQDNFKGLQTVDHKSVITIVRACRSIIGFYTGILFIPKSKKVLKVNTTIKLFAKNMKYVKDTLKGYSLQDLVSVNFAIKSMKSLLKFFRKDSLKDRQITRARKNISLLSHMASAMLNISKINPLDVSAVSDSLTTALSGVKSIDISQVEAVTNMFNAFQGINKSENIINKFAESVKEFTSTCKDLMDAMNENTEALTNVDSSDTESEGGSLWDRLKNKVSGFIGGSENNYSATPPQTTNGVRITNVDELAKTIAEKINGSLSVDMPDTQIQLLINGTGGNEWTITKY